VWRLLEPITTPRCAPPAPLVRSLLAFFVLSVCSHTRAAQACPVWPTAPPVPLARSTPPPPRWLRRRALPVRRQSSRRLGPCSVKHDRRARPLTMHRCMALVFQMHGRCRTGGLHQSRVTRARLRCRPIHRWRVLCVHPVRSRHFLSVWLFRCLSGVCVVAGGC
jgi:hypothetical protein